MLADEQNEVLDRLRQREATDGSAENPRTGELDLDELIGQLDPDRREAFVLTQVAGLSYAEAALACDVPIGTIRSRVARARADLLNGLVEERGTGSGS